MHVGGFNFAPTDKEWRPTPRTMDAVSKESLRQAFDEYLRGPSEVNITKPPHSVYPHYVHDDAQMEARLETFDGFRINYAEPCEIAGGTIVSNLVGISLYSPKYISKSQRLLASCDQVSPHPDPGPDPNPNPKRSTCASCSRRTSSASTNGPARSARGARPRWWSD